MDDAAIALLTAGSSLLGVSVGAFTTYKGNLRSTQAAVETARSQHEVELARITAETERLQDGNREEERRNRQSTYHRFIEAAFVVHQRMGVKTSHKEIMEIGGEYRQLIAGVFLFAPHSVRDGALDLNRIYQQIWPTMLEVEERDPEASIEDRWKESTTSLKPGFGDAISNLVHLMHADVTRGITEDP